MSHLCQVLSRTGRGLNRVGCCPRVEVPAEVLIVSGVVPLL